MSEEELLKGEEAGSTLENGEKDLNNLVKRDCIYSDFVETTGADFGSAKGAAVLFVGGIGLENGETEREGFMPESSCDEPEMSCIGGRCSENVVLIGDGRLCCKGVRGDLKGLSGLTGDWISLLEPLSKNRFNTFE